MKTHLLPTVTLLALCLATAHAETKTLPTPTATAPLTDKQKKALEAERRARIQAKLDRIILPSVQLSEVTVEEAVDYLRTRSLEGDAQEKDSTKKGINFVILNGASNKDPNTQPGKRMIHDLQLRNVPISTVLQYICELSGLKMSVDSHSVILRP